MKRYVILDRDGTIIHERHHLADPADVELIPGAAAALVELRRLGLGIVVITNQSVVGRGMVDEAGLESIHHRMHGLLADEGAAVDAIYHCPHLPEDGCGCRKPRTELVERAASDLGFDPRESFVVGDHASDIELGKRLGATTILVLTGHGREEGGEAADHTATNLGQAAGIICDVVSGGTL